MYHTGVLIDGREYTFAGEAGIFNHPPRSVPNAKYRQSIKMGTFEGGESRINEVIRELRDEFKGSDYSLILKNCNCFAATFVKKLNNQDIPAWINRMAEIGQFCSCLLPSSVLNQPSADSDSNPLVGDKNSSQFQAFKGKGNRLTSN